MWWGVAAALMANTLYSLGFVLEKRALSGLPEVTIRKPARLLRLVIGSPLWIGGSLALAAGFGAQLVVYRTLPIAAAQGKGAKPKSKSKTSRQKSSTKAKKAAAKNGSKGKSSAKAKKGSRAKAKAK